MFKIVTAAVILLALSGLVSAKLMGAGAAAGAVFESWTAGERVVFRLNIANQKTDAGPALATPAVFVYAGDDRAKITEGDTVKLRYDSSDANGIIVTELEFIEDRPGAVGQSKTLSLAITAAGLIVGISLIVGGIIHQKRRQQQQQRGRRT